jgi:hypothetical protein
MHPVPACPAKIEHSWIGPRLQKNGLRMIDDLKHFRILGVFSIIKNNRRRGIQVAGLGSVGGGLTSPDSFGRSGATPDVEASNPVIGSGGSRHIQLGVKLIW